MDMNLYEKIAACKTAEEFSLLRNEIKDTFQREEYGYFPEKPLSVSGEVVSREETMAGKSILENIRLTITLGSGEYLSRSGIVIPKRRTTKPWFCLISEIVFPINIFPPKK